MEKFISAIRGAIQSENWHAAIFLSLAMPDICAKLEHPELKSSGPRYRAWFYRFLAPINRTNIMGHEVTFMTAGDCWALRCSIFHEGTDVVEDQPASETVSRFRFTTLGTHRGKIEDVLILNTSRFCEEMCGAVEAWCIEIEGNAEIQQRIAAMVRIEQGTFSPHPGVRIL